jgi:tetratricopeptide (TPR) repeat protein
VDVFYIGERTTEKIPGFFDFARGLATLRMTKKRRRSAMHRSFQKILTLITISVCVTVAGVASADSSAHVAQAKAAFSSGDYTDAIREYTDALNEGGLTDKERAEIYNGRGQAYRESRQYQDAIADYDAALRLRPKFPDAMLNRAIAYDRIGQGDQAIAGYGDTIKTITSIQAAKLAANIPYPEPAAQLEQNLEGAYLDRGIALAKHGKFNESVKDFEQAARLEPDNPKAFEDLGHAMILTGDNDAAITAYNRAIRLDGSNANAYLNRGAAWYQKKDFARATDDFRTALKVAPANWIGRDDAEANLKMAERQIKSAPTKGAGNR